MRYLRSSMALLMAGLLTFTGCGSGTSTPPASTDPAEPVFALSLFSAPTVMSNAYFPLPVGQARIFQTETEDGMETVLEQVLDTTRTVAGVPCVCVRVREWLGELIIEDSEDWYAQDDAGNVWYMGEAVINYEYDDDDNLIGTNGDGSWEAAADVAGLGSNATAGIIMKADLKPGDSYSQEIYPGQAEDMGAIVALGEGVTLACGTLFTCLKTRDWNPLEPDSTEYKYYAAGLGMVMSEDATGEERVEPAWHVRRYARQPARLRGSDVQQPHPGRQPVLPARARDGAHARARRRGRTGARDRRGARRDARRRRHHLPHRARARIRGRSALGGHPRLVRPGRCRQRLVLRRGRHQLRVRRRGRG